MFSPAYSCDCVLQIPERCVFIRLQFAVIIVHIIGQVNRNAGFRSLQAGHKINTINVDILQENRKCIPQNRRTARIRRHSS